MRLLILLAALGLLVVLLPFLPAILLEAGERRKTREAANLNQRLQRARELDAAGIKETWEEKDEQTT